MSKVDLDRYVTVAERVQKFSEKYPTGSLSFEVVEWRDLPTHGMVVIGRAFAHREPGDPSPGVGWAMEFVPGRTNFTKGSEVQNLETSAWGRAIAALGIEVQRGIASREEMRAAQGRQDAPPFNPAPGTPEADLLALIRGAQTRDELTALVDTVKAQPDPEPLQAAARKRWGEVG
jgi:hypothetical protein